MSLRNTGDRVTHAQYGHGTVSRVDVFHTCIDFDDHGRRTFLSPRVVLTDSMVPAPVKPARVKRTASRKKAAD